MPLVIEASFAIRGGLANLEKHYPEPVLEAASKYQPGLQELLLGAAHGNGYSVRPGERITQGNLRAVLQAAFATVHAAGFSTVGLPGILSNTANKFLLDGWVEMGDEWKAISATKPVRDFKQASFYRLLDGAEYEQVAETGEIKHGTLGEQQMTLEAETYGRLYVITRQAIINDDLGALTDIPRRLGRAAAQKFRNIFWAAFLADDGFFDHATNGNELTGAGTELTATGGALELALTYFRAQRTPAADGAKRVGGKPAVMMVPGSLDIVARRLLNSASIVSGTDAMIPAGNPFQGLAELVSVDQLEDTDFTGASADKWYLFRSPALAPAMLVGFLNGQQNPTVETADADFQVLGIQMRGYHDWAVGRGEPLAGVQVAGTPA